MRSRPLTSVLAMGALLLCAGGGWTTWPTGPRPILSDDLSKITGGSDDCYWYGDEGQCSSPADSNCEIDGECRVGADPQAAWDCWTSYSVLQGVDQTYDTTESSSSGKSERESSAHFCYSTTVCKDKCQYDSLAEKWICLTDATNFTIVDATASKPKTESDSCTFRIRQLRADSPLRLLAMINGLFLQPFPKG